MAPAGHFWEFASRVRVLVVDDDPDLLVLLCHRLEQLGYAVRTAAHGPEALELLQQYDWPGNVCELENVIERAVVFSSGKAIEPEDLAFPTLRGAPPPVVDTSQYHIRLEAVEQEALCEALQAHGGDKRAAAQALGLGLSTLYAKLKKYQL
jgi:DNA-binding NtrC family response regulator